MPNDAGGLKVVGQKSLIAGLRRAGVPDAEIKKAGFESAEIVANKARQPGFVPVKSGALRRSIRSAKALRGASVSAGGKRVPYANPIHWGWFYDRKNFVYKNIKPNPFFARALGYTRDEVLKNYYDNIDKLMKNVSDFQNPRDL
jgi:hypothetical protein